MTGPEAAKVLAQSNDIAQLLTAIECLDRLGDRPLLEQALAARIDDPNVAVARLLILHLGFQRPLQYREPLLAALRRHNDDRRAELLLAIGMLRERDLLDVLLTYAADPDPWIRAHAAQALGETGDPRAIPMLTALLQDRTEVLAGDHPGEPGDTVADLARRALDLCR